MPLTENVFIKLEYAVSSYLSFNNHNTSRTWGWDKIFAMFEDSKWFPPAMTRMSKICLLFLLSSSCAPNIQGKGAFKHGAAPGDGENISLIPSWLECLLFWIRARLGQLRVVAEWENPPVSVCLFLSGFQNQRKDLFSKMKHLPMINLTQWNFLKTLSETDWDTGPNPRDISAFKKVCFQICLGSCLPLHRRQRACAHYQRVLSCKIQFLDLIFYS